MTPSNDLRRVYHWSRKLPFKTTNPELMGTGILGKTKSPQLPGTFFGEDTYYEPLVQGNSWKYFAYLDYSKIYNYDLDSEKTLLKAVGESRNTGKSALLVFEQSLLDLGYIGYSTHSVVKCFAPIPVNRDYDVREVTEADAEEFSNSVLAAREVHKNFGVDKQLTLYSVEDYKTMRLFIGRDKTAGFALQGDNIISVFSHPFLSPGASPNLLDLAVRNGGRRVDIFDTYLPKLYAREGFRVVARMLWDEQYAPKGWDYSAMKQFNNGRPDVVFMIYDPKTRTPVVNSYEEAELLQQAALSE